MYRQLQLHQALIQLLLDLVVLDHRIPHSLPWVRMAIPQHLEHHHFRLIRLLLEVAVVVDQDLDLTTEEELALQQVVVQTDNLQALHPVLQDTLVELM